VHFAAIYRVMQEERSVLRQVTISATMRKIPSYDCGYNNNNNNIYLFTAIGLSPVGSGYFTCKQNMKLVTTKFKSGGLHEKHVVATWNLGNHPSICF